MPTDAPVPYPDDRPADDHGRFRRSAAGDLWPPGRGVHTAPMTPTIQLRSPPNHEPSGHHRYDTHATGEVYNVTSCVLTVRRRSRQLDDMVVPVPRPSPNECRDAAVGHRPGAGLVRSRVDARLNRAARRRCPIEAHRFRQANPGRGPGRAHAAALE